MIEKLLKAVSLNDGEEVELSLKEEIICTIISFLIIGLLLYFAATSSESLSANNEKTAEDSTYTESTLPHAWGIIRYGDTGAYLEKDGKLISGYYKVIEEDYDYDTLRVIGMNGLYGFISKYR
jgi:antitoxin component of MazEF toxin-antitoxin module